MSHSSFSPIRLKQFSTRIQHEIYVFYKFQLLKSIIDGQTPAAHMVQLVCASTQAGEGDMTKIILQIPIYQSIFGGHHMRSNN